MCCVCAGGFRLQEYTKSQVIGLINLVATANNWKRKSRVDMVERIEAGDL